MTGLLSICIIGCKKSKDEVKAYVASGHPSWAPIMYNQGDLIQGAGPEIVGMIFSELGLIISFPYVGSWDIVQEKALSGEIDLIVAAYKTPERETYMDYSVSYTTDPVSIFVKNGKAFPFVSWSELVGKKGVVTIGDSYGQEFDQFIKDSLTVVSTGSPEEAYNLILNSQADYFVYALYSGENFIASNNLKEQIEILSNYVSSENFHITISKKSSLVYYLPQINKILERFKKDGTIDRIIKKYK